MKDALVGVGIILGVILFMALILGLFLGVLLALIYGVAWVDAQFPDGEPMGWPAAVALVGIFAVLFIPWRRGK